MSGAAVPADVPWRGQGLLAHRFVEPGAAYDLVLALIPAGAPCPGAELAQPDEVAAIYRLDHDREQTGGGLFNPELGVLLQTVGLRSLLLHLAAGVEDAWDNLGLQASMSRRVLAAVDDWLSQTVVSVPRPGRRSRLSPLARSH
jgi:hypothetical protein